MFSKLLTFFYFIFNRTFCDNASTAPPWVGISTLFHKYQKASLFSRTNKLHSNLTESHFLISDLPSPDCSIPYKKVIKRLKWDCPQNWISIKVTQLRQLQYLRSFQRGRKEYLLIHLLVRKIQGKGGAW